jgi:hypothetical protein
MRTETIICALLITVIASSAAPQKLTTEEVKQEFKYAEELRKLGLNDFADKVLINIPEDKIPQAMKNAMMLAKFQTYLRTNYKEPAKLEAYIKSLTAKDIELYWVLKLRWADEMWSRGENDKCLKVYESFMEFFDKVLKESKEKKPTGIKPGQEVG